MKFKNKNVDKLVDKKKDIIALLLWMLFILFVFIYIKVGDNKKLNEYKPEIKFVSVSDGLEKLNNRNYEYNFAITDNEDIIYYTGSLNGSINSGVRLHNDEVINYYMDGINTYNVDTKELINIYDSYLYYFLDTNNISEFIKDIKPSEVINDSIKVYTYSKEYMGDIITFDISVSSNNITLIKYEYKSIKYNMNFSNVGGVKDISKSL